MRLVCAAPVRKVEAINMLTISLFISTEGVADREAITKRVSGGGVAGQAFETVAGLKGVDPLDKLDDARAVILTRTESGQVDLKTIPLP